MTGFAFALASSGLTFAAARVVSIVPRKDRRGKVVVMEEHYTSHRFDAEADDQSPDRIKELEAAQALLSALQTYRKVTGRL